MKVNILESRQFPVSVSLHDQLEVVRVKETMVLVEKPNGVRIWIDRNRLSTSSEIAPVAWGESYDGGKTFVSVRQEKTKHHTYPLYMSLESIVNGKPPPSPVESAK